MTYTFDVTAFRATYPVFANPIDYPDIVLQNNYDLATCYISDNGSGWQTLKGNCRYQALTLMTAHLTALRTMEVDTGATSNTAFIQSATIDKITVTNAVPPIKNGWQSWLAQTPYGQQLWALLLVSGAGGFYIGGLPESAAFRRVGGIFI